MDLCRIWEPTVDETSRYGLWPAAASALLALCVPPACDRDSSHAPDVRSSGAASEAIPNGSSASRGDGHTLPADVRKACSSCHRLVPPAALPKRMWRKKIQLMAALAQRRDVDLGVSAERAIRAHQVAAPSRVPHPQVTPQPAGRKLRWTQRPARFRGPGSSPAVGNLTEAKLGADATCLVVSDMGTGAVTLYTPATDDARRLARLRHPCRAVPVDLDADGRQDFLVADLGTFKPSKAKKAGVVWLRQAKQGHFKPVRLAEGLRRVADARPADFDGDGDLDIVVGVFGWRDLGRVFWMENVTQGDGPMRFDRHVLDTRSGAVRAAAVDVDGDGRKGVVALLTQETERVVWYRWTGNGFAKPQPLYAAPHARWGFSGLSPVDFDEDGDPDFLVTNGEPYVPEPYHGIHFLENRGAPRFKRHRLASMYAVHRAAPVDFDGDGDLDVLAAAWMFKKYREAERRPEGGYEGLIWLENKGDLEMARHVLKPTAPVHPTVLPADLDGDGDPDFAAGHLYIPPTAHGAAPVTLWFNEASRASPARQ